MKNFTVCTFIGFVFLAFMLVGASYAQIGFWQFDEGAGETAIDSSGSGLDGNLLGGPNWVDRNASKALEFDGIDDYVEIPGISTPPILTFACWFKKTGSGNGGVPRIHSSGGNPWALEFGIGNTHQPSQLEFYLAFTDGSATGWTAFSEPEEGVWYHTAISYDGTSVRTYVDGKEVYASKNWAGKEINTNISRIGGHAANGDCFQGVMDEVALFDAVLSEADIKSLMTDWRSIALLDKAASIWGNIKSRAIQ